jgi:hypothetical protein
MVPFVPQNPLEHVLVAAVAESDARATFYRLMLESFLYVIDEGEAGGGATGHPILAEGTTLQIVNVEIGDIAYVPVFSSMPRLEAVIREPRRYVSLLGRDFFQIVRGSHVILNFGSEYGKQFVPSEIDAMLDGTIEQAMKDSGPVTPRRRWFNLR